MPLIPSGDKPLTAGGNASVDDIESFFASDDEPEIKKVDKEDKPTKDVDDIELKDEDVDDDKIDLKDDKKKKEDDKDDKEEEDEDEDEKIKDEDEVEIDAPPKKKAILAKYPDVFKDFPFLEKMLYRDKQYQELFGSFDDAKEAHGKIEAYEHFENLLAGGDTGEVLKTIKEGDSKIFDKVVDNYLLTLHSVDKDAYFEVIGNVGKTFIARMVAEAKDSDNDALREAALLLNQFLFGNSKYEPIKPRTTVEKNAEKDEIEQERLALARERFDTARNDLQGRADNILRNTISEYIDPRSVMTSYIKKHAVNEAMNNLSNSLAEDESLKKNLDKLWRAAHDVKYTKESLDRIQSAYLGRAKALAPAAIKKARAEALRDVDTRGKKEPTRDKDEDEEETTPRKRTPAIGRPSSQRRSTNEMEPGESVLDFLSRD